MAGRAESAIRSLALAGDGHALLWTLDCGRRARSRLGAATAIDKRWFCRARYPGILAVVYLEA